MRDTIDITRSLRRYAWKHLEAYDEDFDVRLAIEEDAFERPMAVVQTAGPVQTGNQGRRTTTFIRPFVIYAYPKEGATAKEAELNALQVEETLYKAFRQGGHYGHPARIPIHDWSEVDYDEALPDDAWEGRIGYMRVTDCNVDHRPDPDDEKLQTVICNVRLDWLGYGEIPEDGPLAEDFTSSVEVN